MVYSRINYYLTNHYFFQSRQTQEPCVIIEPTLVSCRWALKSIRRVRELCVECDLWEACCGSFQITLVSMTSYLISKSCEMILIQMDLSKKQLPFCGVHPSSLVACVITSLTPTLGTFHMSAWPCMVTSLFCFVINVLIMHRH